MEKFTKPNYQKIYKDLITKKYPDIEGKCQSILAKKDLSVMDIIKLNQLILPEDIRHDGSISSQKHRSYDKETILQFLKYQEENDMNNKELALHFRLSRNSITKWKRLFSKQ